MENSEGDTAKLEQYRLDKLNTNEDSIVVCHLFLVRKVFVVCVETGEARDNDGGVPAAYYMDRDRTLGSCITCATCQRSLPRTNIPVNPFVPFWVRWWVFLWHVLVYTLTLTSHEFVMPNHNLWILW